MKTALITGASSGIGREFARQLARSGYDRIYCIARREGKLAELKGELGDMIIPLTADLAKEDSFVNITDRLKNDGTKQITTLVAAAGFGKYGSFANNSESDMEAEVNVNIIGLMRTVRLALPFLKNGSQIILMGSQSAFQPLPEFNVYASTKAFVLHFGRALSRELKKDGISVTTVCPGYVDTEFFSVAEKSGDPTACRNFKPMCKTCDVVRHAISDAERGKDVSVYGGTIKAARLLSKILPHSLVMKVWLKIR